MTERTTHVSFSLNAWREDSHQTLHFCRSGYWTLLQLLETLASPHLRRSCVSNCLKQIIYDWRHYWLFRSQHRNQYQKPFPSIQQTTCSHRTRDLRVTLPVETRQYKTLPAPAEEYQPAQMLQYSLYAPKYVDIQFQKLLLYSFNWCRNSFHS